MLILVVMKFLVVSLVRGWGGVGVGLTNKRTVLANRESHQLPRSGLKSKQFYLQSDIDLKRMMEVGGSDGWSLMSTSD